MATFYGRKCDVCGVEKREPMNVAYDPKDPPCKGWVFLKIEGGIERHYCPECWANYMGELKP